MGTACANVGSAILTSLRCLHHTIVFTRMHRSVKLHDMPSRSPRSYQRHHRSIIQERGMRAYKKVMHAENEHCEKRNCWSGGEHCWTVESIIDRATSSYQGPQAIIPRQPLSRPHEYQMGVNNLRPMTARDFGNSHLPSIHIPTSR